jgi:hypothetical protein
MTPHHFAKMYESKSRRHDSLSDSAMFNEAVGTITGMLYSIVTLKAFFPFFRSPEKITDNTVTHAPYPMPSQKSGHSDYEKKITMGENFSPYQAILPGDQDDTPNSL